MATDCIAQVTFNFDRKRKPVVAAFDTEHASSDGGAILLKGIDTQLGLTKRLAACLQDERQPGKIQHQTLELFRQRVFGIACGYADCNDAARLADDAIHKLLVDRDPIAGPALASQPTLSRFENAVGWRELLRMGHVLADTVIAHHRRRLKGRARRITIDLDPTDDPTHGQQEFAFFNGHYDTWCYLPAVATVTFDAEADQYAVAAGLRPGTAPASLGLRRLVLPVAIQSWSLTSLQQRLFKTGGRLIRHARYFTLQLAESYLTRPLFRQIVARIERLAGHPT